jgi:hypothetical protein
VAAVSTRRIRRLIQQSHDRAHDPEATPVERLAHLHDLAKHLVDYNIELAKQARRDGATWAEIGAALEITPQAAQKRYRPFTRA